MHQTYCLEVFKKCRWNYQFLNSTFKYYIFYNPQQLSLTGKVLKKYDIPIIHCSIQLSFQTVWNEKFLFAKFYVCSWLFLFRICKFNLHAKLQQALLPYLFFLRRVQLFISNVLVDERISRWYLVFLTARDISFREFKSKMACDSEIKCAYTHFNAYAKILFLCAMYIRSEPTTTL